MRDSLIRTEYVRPPIPTTMFDWMAFIEGDEGDGPTGRGQTEAEALRERCVVDPATRCWHWQGAMSKGQPRIYALDLTIMDKRVMPGTRAAWQIAHGEPIAPGRMIYRVCGCRDCVNPVHLREARSLAEVGANIRGSGRLKGKFTDARRASLEKAWASAGFRKQPEEVVRAIRQAPADVTGYALSKLHGVSESVVSRIRRGETYRGLV